MSLTTHIQHLCIYTLEYTDYSNNQFSKTFCQPKKADTYLPECMWVSYRPPTKTVHSNLLQLSVKESGNSTQRHLIPGVVHKSSNPPWYTENLATCIYIDTCRPTTVVQYENYRHTHGEQMLSVRPQFRVLCTLQYGCNPGNKIKFQTCIYSAHYFLHHPATYTWSKHVSSDSTYMYMYMYVAIHKCTLYTFDFGNLHKSLFQTVSFRQSHTAGC